MLNNGGKRNQGHPKKSSSHPFNVQSLLYENTKQQLLCCRKRKRQSCGVHSLCRELAEISQRLFRHGAARDIQNKLYIGYCIIFEAVSPAAFSVKYPAHLHIDILPEYQGQKVGTALMSALKEKLVSDNIKGVMLCVGKGNM